MSIEKSLERIADAIEKIADVTVIPPAAGGPVAEVTPAKKTTKKKADKKEDPTPPPAKDQPTEDDLRAIFQEYVGKKGNEEGTVALKELITRYGAAKIGEIKPEDYAVIINEVKAWN